MSEEMYGADEAGTSPLRILVIIASAVSLAVLTLVVWALCQPKPGSTGGIDWAAAAGIGATALASIVSMWTGLAAVYAARMALVVDRRVAARARDAKARDTQMLALVFKSELQTLRERGEEFVKKCETAAAREGPRPAFGAFYDSVGLPILAQHVGELGVFDGDVRATLAAAMRVVMTWRWMVNPSREPRENYPVQQYTAEIGQLVTNMKAGLVAIHNAEVALETDKKPYSTAPAVAVAPRQ